MRIYKVRWIPGYAEAITLPPLGVLVEREHAESEKLLNHERGHWLQYKEWGLFKFYWIVLTQYLRYGPRNAPVERDATERGKNGNR